MTHKNAIKNMVALAVASLINGEQKAPSVPTALTSPKVSDKTLLGKS
jgi:hypothetical protein